MESSTVKILLHMLKSDENWELELKSLSFVFTIIKKQIFRMGCVVPRSKHLDPNGAALQAK